MAIREGAPRPHLASPRLLDRQPASQPRTREILLPTGRDIIAAKLCLIGQAKYSIDMQYYSFEADETGKKILEACRDAKERNGQLKIRLLVDNSVEYLHNGEIVGSSEEARRKRDETNELLMQMRDKDIFEVVDVTNRFNVNNKWTNRLHFYSNILHRDHKKLFLVDARDVGNHPDATPKAIVGSANINRHHEYYWKDAARLFEGGEIVKALAEDFEYTANHAKKWERIYEVQNPQEYIKRYGFWRQLFTHPLQLGSDIRGAVVRNAERKGKRVVTTPDPKGRRERDEVVATDSFFPKWFLGLGERAATNEVNLLLKKAKPGGQVTVATPYPGFYTITGRLIQAAKRGVDVSLVIPKDNNHVLYNHRKIDAFHFSESIPNWLQGTIRRAAHRQLDGWERKLAKGGVGVYKYTGKHEGLSGMIHFKGAEVVRKDGTTRSINGSLNYTKGPISGMNREVIVATEGTKDTDPMVPFMENLKANAEYVPPTRTYKRRTKAA